jgi:hypothetical protein
VFAQYFGWREILRQDIQFLGSDDQSTTFARDPTRTLPFRLWKPEQRAIGELMVTHEHDVKTCVGYSKFVKARHEELALWLSPLEQGLVGLAARTSDGSRLRDIQHRLCEVIRALDPERVRYPDSDLRLA